MMGIQYEVTAVTGKYTDATGKEKSRYQKIGVVMQTKNGSMLKLESVPVGWDGWAYLNKPRENMGGSSDTGSSTRAAASKPGTKKPEFDDDIPF